MKNIKIGFWIPFILIFFSNSTLLYSQASLRKATRYYKQYSYVKAIEFYKKAYEKKRAARYKDSICTQLADCYHKTRNFEQTEYWYHQVQDVSTMKSNHLYRYAETLINIGKYDEARPLLERYKALNTDDDRISHKIDALEHLKEYFVDSSQYKLHLMNINSPEADFSPIFYREGLLFVSSREHSSMSTHKTEWDNTNFLDLYYTEISETGIFKEPQPFDSKINSSLHEGPSTINAEESLILFTRNNTETGEKGHSEDGTQKLRIYQAERKAHGWGNIKPFIHSSSEYSTGHPTITPDGKTLYFVSDIDSGYGESDIYVCHFENDQWTKPKNVGHLVNTAGKEMFPYIHKNGTTLYFASDGQGGIGGLDIFSCEWNDSTKQFEDLQNLGYPINTRYDDFGIVIDRKKHFGFVTSNRPGGVGSDDLYDFEIIDFGEITIQGQTFSILDGQKEEKREILVDATILVYDSTTHEKITQLSTDHEGLYDLVLDRKKSYQIIADHPSLNSVHDTIYINTHNLKQEKIERADLTLIIPLGKKVHFIEKVKDVKTGEPLANAYLQIMNTQTKEIQTILTDSLGKIDVMLDAETDYIIHGSKTGYFSNCIRFTTPAPTPTLQTTSKALTLKKIEKGTGLDLTSVYFDSNSSELKPNAKKALDQVIQFLQRYTEVKIEISSHTDSRGSAIYNEKLSIKRSRSAVGYIIEHGGIDMKRVIAKGYGETKLVNRCKDRVPCSDTEHQANRRTELKILEVEEAPVENVEKFYESQKLDKEVDYSDCQYIPVTAQEEE